MHPTRRRKKRPNYGIRTVEVYRGKNGFGFTISGQQPCILSCIVANSPAEEAGLRPGDYLIAVGGRNVSKVPHDDVVQLIGNCYGLLKLQIAENYYSDSSEDDFTSTARPKPKHANKNRTNNYASAAPEAEERFRLPQTPRGADYEAPVAAYDASNDDENSILRCIVGYLGTIEMPAKSTPTSRNQIVCGCVKRLRSEKRSATPVLMTVLACSVRLRNSTGTTIAVYPGGRVTHCGPEEDVRRRYFGVVTSVVGDAPADSCHVFVTLGATHAEHAAAATRFGIQCAEECADYFPGNAEPVVRAIRRYYEDQVEPEADSPQPSESVTTSNSDSGIGFRDDCGHQSDRILVVDIQNQRLHIRAAGRDPQCIDCSSEKMSDRSGNTTTNSSTATVDMGIGRATNDPSVESLNELSYWPVKTDASRCTTRISARDVTDSLERRLSPKVFGNVAEMQSVSQSLDDFKMQNGLYEEVTHRTELAKKHSLQDLSMFANDEEKTKDRGQEESDRKVTGWASSLEKLLYDVVGLHTFAEFLKKEFSVENAYFWAACEKFKRCTATEERRKLAQLIFEKFLSPNATDPVNVDAVGKNFTQQQLQSGDINLLQNAQKQIFNLMKFDSYPRFLKSDLYKNFLMREISGEVVSLDQSADPDLLLVAPTELAARSNEELQTCGVERNQRSTRRRRSLLPWSKSRCKSRDRAASNENVSSCDSHTSLASWDLALPVSLCRVILPDGSSTVVNVHPQQTVYSLVGKLLEKRAMPYTSFQVVLTANDKAVNLEENSSSLAGKEIRIDWRIEFRLDLPDRKSLTVKSKPTHTLGAVLGPILINHGYNLQMVTLCLMSENEVLEPSMLIGGVDRQRIQVLTRSTPTPNLQGWTLYDCAVKPPMQPVSLDEITNRVFDELLHEKSETFRSNVAADATPSLHSEDWSSESSGILGKLLRKDSFHQDKLRKNKKTDGQNGSEKKVLSNRLQPVIAKWKPVVSKLDVRFEKEGLYEGIKRCQRGRLEDQRGTEINSELPDFLKDKENTPSGRKKVRKVRKDTELKDKECYLMDKNPNAFDELFKEPPPLPPKPKTIPKPPVVATGYELGPPKVYLDRPTSSFV